MNTDAPSLNIPLFKVFMPPSVLAPLQQTLMSGYIGEGPRVAQFERELAAWLGVPGVVAVNSATSALHLALALAGVGPGDEVVTTPMTCVATNTPIVHLGARPVWADIDPNSGNIAAEDVARKCSAKTRAIVAVHWGGTPCDLEALARVARHWSLALIEDASHALGSRYQGRCIGGHSDFVCFSFQAIKMLTTGDGGALVCKAAADAQRARRLRWFGLDRSQGNDDECRWEQDIAEPGYKYHMNDIAATLGSAQLPYLAANVARHQAHAARLDAALRGYTQVRPLLRHPDRLSAHWLYTVRVRQRGAFVAHMRAAGVGASRVHVRNDTYRLFAPYACAGLSGVDVFDAEQVNIPCGWWLGNQDLQTIERALQQYEARA